MRKIIHSLRALKYNLLGDSWKRIRTLEERVESLDMLFKSFHDITTVPPARGGVRVMQLAAVAVLKTISEIFASHGVPYFMESGTLIGAVRHRGFVPWDDDIDIGVMRDDYNRIPELLANALSRDDYAVVRSSCIRVILKGTPCQIDIFPYDRVRVPDFSSVTISKFREMYWKFARRIPHDWSRLHTDSNVIPDMSRVEIEDIAAEFLSQWQVGSIPALSYGVEVSPGSLCIVPESCVFPVMDHEFESAYFSAPAKPHEFLLYQYGDYMSYPKCIHYHEDIMDRMSVVAMMKMSEVIGLRSWD